MHVDPSINDPQNVVSAGLALFPAGTIALPGRTHANMCRNQHFINELEFGPMPNVMAALPNIDGALCSMPQSLADAHY